MDYNLVFLNQNLKSQFAKLKESIMEWKKKKATSATNTKKQEMFSNLFSFEGRIRRTEFGISVLIYSIVAPFANMLLQSDEAPIIGFSIFIPLLWFQLSQGAKRCHDLGNNGWWQIVPFYLFWLLFQDGQPRLNKYGHNPKG